MRVSSVRAAVLRDPGALAPTRIEPPASAPWKELDGVPSNVAPTWPDVVCIVTADDGTWGFGASSFGGPVTPVVNDHLAGIVVGSVIESTTDLTVVWDRMDRACGAHYGSAGLASYAMSAVDLALWDCFAKTRETPVWQVLGGRRRRIDTYATGSATGDYLELGHRAVKLPCSLRADGTVDHDSTLRAVAGARSVLGQERDLMLDAWDVLDVDAAIDMGRATSEFGLRWFEDSVFPEDWPGYRRLREALPDVTLAAGERWYTHRPFEQMATARAVDVLQPDPLWVGGVTPVLRIAEVARTHGIELALHCGGNDPFGQHLSTALAEVEVAEVYYGGRAADALSSYRPFAGVATSVDGCVEASDAPGFGLEFGLEAVEQSV